MILDPTADLQAVLEEQDRELMERYEGMECLPRTAVESVSIVQPIVTVKLAFPLVIEVQFPAADRGDDEVMSFREFSVPGLDPTTTTIAAYKEHFDVPRDLVVVEDTEDGSTVWFAIAEPNGDLTPCLIRSWPPNGKVADHRNTIDFLSPHPSGRPHVLKVGIKEALLLEEGTALTFRYPMVDAFNRNIGRDGEWGLGNGDLDTWLPLEKPFGPTYPTALKEGTKGFTAATWPSLLAALRNKFLKDDFHGKGLDQRAKLKKLTGNHTGAIRGELRVAKPAFDGIVGHGIEAPAAAFGALGYFIFYYPDTEGTVRVVVVDSSDGHKGLYVFAGEDCVQQAEDWATRGNQMTFQKARRSAVRWFPHTHEWRDKVVRLIQQLLAAAKQPS